MVSEQALDEVVNEVRRRFQSKPRVAIAGFGKAGKSSLFNAIYGAQVASVSMRTDETVAASTRERFGIDFTDTPGVGTARFSLRTVIESGALDSQHVVIHLLNGTAAISAEDEELHRWLGERKIPSVTAVNKVDLLEESERAEYASSLGARLGTERFFFVSAKRGTGIAELVDRVAELLPRAMQDAFVAQQQADHALKDRRVRTLIYSKAGIAAAVGAIPLPFADSAVLAPMQIGMVAAIGWFYGVEVTRARAVELLATLGTGFTLREGARNLVKLVPGWGAAVSSAIAFAGTVAIGESARVWFRSRMQAPPEELREAFRASAERARAEFARSGTAGAERIAELRRRLEAGEIDEAEFQRLLATLGDAGDDAA